MNYKTQPARSKAKAKVFLSQNHIFWALVSLIAFFVFFYGYFINATVLNTVSLQNVEEEIVDTRSEISQIEFALIEENKNFTMEYAANIGLVDISDTVFIARNSASLSLND
jgi:hypothetical protein